MDRHRDVPFYRDRSAGFDSVENEPEEIAYTATPIQPIPVG